MGLNSKQYDFQVTFYANRQLMKFFSNRIEKEADKYINIFYNTEDENNLTGTLLVDFLNTDLNDINSFKIFFNKYGYSAFEGISNIINKTNLNNFDDNSYSAFIVSVLNDSKLNGHLNYAQEDFKKITNYCFNINNLSHLKQLSPTKRYFVGVQKSKISYFSISIVSEYFKDIEISYNAELIHKKPCNSEFFIGTNFEKKLEIINYDEKKLSDYITEHDVSIQEEYKTNNFLSICYVELMEIIKKETSINLCQNCNKYFLPQIRSNEVYCNNCKEVGYENKVKNDLYMTAYRNEYKSRHAKLRSITNPDKRESSKNKLSEWARIALVEAKKAKELNEDIKEFKTFLKKMEV